MNRDWLSAAELMRKLAEHARKFSDLGVLQVLPVATPDGHPDLDDFDHDMADMHKLARFAKTEAKTVTNRNWSPDDIHRHLADNNIYTTIHRQMVTEHNDRGRTSPETAMLADFIAFRDIGIRIRQWT